MAVQIVMPRLGDFMTEGIVAKWAKSQGDAVDQGDTLAEIESEKLNYELQATSDGVFHPVVEEGATVPVDGVIGYLLAAGEAPPPPKPAAASATPAAPSTPPRRRPTTAAARRGDVVPSTPGARRLAASLGVDISQVAPTGPRGRVVDADVRAYHAAQQAAQAPQTPPGLPTPSRIEPLRGMRRSIAQNMRDSLSGAAQLSYFLDVDVTEAQRLRRDASRAGDVNITMASVLIKACANALGRVPALNSVLVDGNVMYFDEVNIGVAVALEDGLIVPVLKGVQDLSVPQIAAGVQALAERARANRLSASDISGGTFTISVLGVVDGFTPILNPPQNALLGVGRSAQKPVVRGGEIVAREMMTLSLTGDHQVIDGAIAASFFRRLQQIVERPAALFR